MMRRITEHFPSGEMLFDGYGRRGVWILQRFVQAPWPTQLSHGDGRIVLVAFHRIELFAPARGRLMSES